LAAYVIKIAQYWLRFIKHEFHFKLNAWTISALVIGLFLFLPMAEVVWHLTIPAESWTHLRETVLGQYIKGSLILVFGTATLSILLGVSSAWLVACCKFPGRKFFEWTLILPLAIPTYIAAYSYFDLLDKLNPFLIWIRLNFSTEAMTLMSDAIVYPVTIIVLASVLYPYVYLVARAAFTQQSNQCIEAARTLGHGPHSTFWRTALPLARPAIVGGVSLVIMETLNDYGAVKHFNIPTFTTGIFRTWLSIGDLPGALRLAACLIVLILFLLILEKWLRFGAKFHKNSKSDRPFKPYELGQIKSFLAILCCLFPLIVGFVLPLSRLAYWASQTIGNVFDSNFLMLTFNSIAIATAASLITVLLAIFLIFTARYFGSRTINATNRLAILGYAAPGAVIAIGILLLSKQVNQATGWIMTGSLSMLVLAYVVRFLAVAWQPIDSGMERNCEQINNASRSLGATALRSLTKINMPLLRNALVAAGLFVFVDTMKELPLTLILRPFNFETLSTKTFDLAQQAQIPESAVPALCIILVSLLPLIWLNSQIRNTEK
jgi:iron(III) transport system permease protein|tara:strand:- start:374 stop:2017 length:1644 start_codon:yes stop_codon:yes gene_type:complete